MTLYSIFSSLYLYSRDFSEVVIFILDICVVITSQVFFVNNLILMEYFYPQNSRVHYEQRYLLWIVLECSIAIRSHLLIHQQYSEHISSEFLEILMYQNISRFEIASQLQTLIYLTNNYQQQGNMSSNYEEMVRCTTSWITMFQAGLTRRSHGVTRRERVIADVSECLTS